MAEGLGVEPKQLALTRQSRSIERTLTVLTLKRCIRFFLC